MNTNEMSKRIEDLMKGGLSLEDALAKVLSEQPTTNRIVDRVVWIRSLGNISELRNAIKIAFAKKSKSKDSPAALARYELEIKAGQDRLNELLADVNNCEHRCIRALELGESLEGVTQFWLEDMEARVNRAIEDKILEKRLQRSAVRKSIGTQSSATPDDLKANLESHHPEMLPIYENRLKRNDQRVATLNKKAALLKTL